MFFVVFRIAFMMATFQKPLEKRFCATFAVGYKFGTTLLDAH